MKPIGFRSHCAQGCDLFRILCFFLALLAALPLLAADYEGRQLDGWTLYVETSFINGHAAELARVYSELHRQFLEIDRAVPAPALARLKTVPFWIHYTSKTPAMTYHPSAKWLAENGFEVRMARGIELGTAANFLSWTKLQPWMVLHELAHAYHDQVLGFDDPRIRAAYEAMKQSGIYASVPYAGGGKRPHYALENEKEYFAESTEAFFGRNDFYPFVRAELEQADPRMAALVKELWGAP